MTQDVRALIFFNPAEEQQNIRVVSLRQWLDWAAGNKAQEWQVSLPMIQRGFVWKPAQIFELWDTLLQGLPIGALLVSELGKNVKSIPLTGQTAAIEAAGGSLGLVDGQQRTLAMLAGWPLPAGTPISHRLWVDFADTPRSGEHFRMRVTTRNQPFGFARDNPNSKLSLAERRKAQTEWLTTQPESAQSQSYQLPDFQGTRPWCNQPSLPLDLRDLMQWWHEFNDARVWKHKVLEHLKAQKAPSIDSTSIWASLGTKHQTLVEQRIDEFATGLKRIHAAQIPLIRLDNGLFTTEFHDTTEPPLALLFKRIGSNATPLSDHDYVYAILKHLRPEVHEMVTRLHGHRGGSDQASVASLMSPTGLAMSALRLAAAAWSPGEKEPRTDPVNPSKEQFHRLIKREGFLDSLLPLLTENQMKRWFDLTLQCLEYRNGADPGLPRHALPCLSRQLVQVLLRLSQAGYLETHGTSRDEARRRDILRLVLYWWLCVHDQNKASLVAYRIIAEDTSHEDDIGQKIMKAIVQASAGHALHSPTSLSQRPELTDTPANLSSAKARGESRFFPKPDDTADRLLCEFWRRWHAPWNHRHSILLWLQRSYVARLPGDPIARRDEDTPYDYDHILPANDWSGWTGAKPGARFIDYCEQAGVIGNSIGNIRVWGSSDNRSDGAASPARKLRLIAESTEEALEVLADRQATAAELLDASAINPQHQDLWADCLPPPGKDNRFWNLDRAKAFERAVEQRAFELYRRVYEEPGFSVWLDVAEAVDSQ